MTLYVIDNAGEVPDPEDGTLYWSNEDGWGHLSTATVFSADERETLNLPLDGVWRALPEGLHRGRIVHGDDV